MGAARSRANRRGRRPRRPAEACAAANNSPCLPPWGKVAPQGRMWGRLPLPPIPGQTVGGGVPDAPRRLAPTAIPRVTTRGDSRCRQHPRRGQDPSLRTEPLTGVRVTPRAGHARPLPCGGPGTGVRVNPAGVSISPSVGRGARRPAKPCAAANNSPCLPPWGKVAPQGRMRGRLPLPPIPGQTAGGGVPDAPENLAPTAIPRVTTRKNPPTQTCGPGMPGPYRAT